MYQDAGLEAKARACQIDYVYLIKICIGPTVVVHVVINIRFIMWLEQKLFAFLLTSNFDD